MSAERTKCWSEGISGVSGIRQPRTKITGETSEGNPRNMAGELGRINGERDETMPYRKTALSARGKRRAGAPPWWGAVVIEEQRYRDLQDELERSRARRSLMVFLGYRYFGASTRWLGEQLGVSHVQVQRLMTDGRAVALSGVAEGDLEKLVEMCFGEAAVGMGWDGASGGPA